MVGYDTWRFTWGIGSHSGFWNVSHMDVLDMTRQIGHMVKAWSSHPFAPYLMWMTCSNTFLDKARGSNQRKKEDNKESIIMNLCPITFIYSACNQSSQMMGVNRAYSIGSKPANVSVFTNIGNPAFLYSLPNHNLSFMPFLLHMACSYPKRNLS